MATKAQLEKLISEAGFVFLSDEHGLRLEPTTLKIKSVKVHLVCRGRYITDPAFVPAELQEKNIVWIDEPPKITAITQGGEEVRVLSPDGNLVFQLEQERVGPEVNHG